MNKKNSILFQISVFFLLVFLFINILIFIQYVIDSKTYRLYENKRYYSAMQIVFDYYKNNLNKEDINKRISVFNLKLSNIGIKELRNNYDEKIIKQDGPMVIYYKDKVKYLHFEPHRPPPFKDEHNLKKLPPPFLGKSREIENIVLVDELNETRFKYIWLLILFIIDIVLIWFYLFIRKKILPLRILKEEMIRFGKGDLSISTKTQENDEISQLANEFDKAIMQLRELTESRNLFLRNIMHELKTPITKGKLIGDMLEKSERKGILFKIFNRLEYLLGEFSKIEELTSGKIVLKRNNYRVVDIIEQAFDILLLSENKIKVTHKNNLIINADYELFSIAFKNLISNALEYNTNCEPEIIIDNNTIVIRNKGNKLEKNIEEYFRPFNHQYESSNKGLGLGLYITNSIIKIHGYKLNYKYEKDYHYFSINVN